METKRSVRTPLKRVQATGSASQSPITKFLGKKETPLKKLADIAEKENSPAPGRKDGFPRKEESKTIAELKKTLDSLKRNLEEKENSEGKLRETVAQFQRTVDELKQNVAVLSAEKEEAVAKVTVVEKQQQQRQQDPQWAGFSPETWTEALEEACKKNEELEERSVGLQRRVDELERGEVKRLRTERDAAKKEASDFLYFYLVEKVAHA